MHEDHKTHHKLLLKALIIGLLVLALGEYLLYRNEMKLNQMLSEGLMQLKEGKQTPVATKGAVMVSPTIKTLKK